MTLISSQENAPPPTVMATVSKRCLPQAEHGADKGLNRGILLKRLGITFVS
jgi:hypothetical protein